ncbi:response regulator [Myxococcota bacterium]|nr:response regulator [Myxococcota bacterium]MBU1537591.1 response regulator [Myxococcota bacterium]
MTTTPRILVVDDEPVEREILTAYLSSGGFETLSAENGAQALALARREPVDCILLDVQMPVMDGFQTIDKLKSEKSLARIPVIFLTSMDRDIMRIRGLESGALHYITKPFNRAVLFATIRSVLKKTSVPLPVADLEGELDDFGLTELLQSLEFGQKTAHIVFEGEEGELYMDRSRLTWVRYRNYYGEDAFLRLLVFGRGRYRVWFGDTYNRESPQDLPLFHVMMDTTRVFDELQGLLNNLPPMGTLISIKESDTHPRFPGEIITLRTAANTLDLSLPETLRILVDIRNNQRMIEVTQEDHS